MTDSGNHLTNDECLKILEFPVVDYEEIGRMHASWLKTPKASIKDRLIPVDELIQKSVADNSTAQAEEIERIKQRASVNKNSLEHTLGDLRSEVAEIEKKLAAQSSDRMTKLMLERKLGEAKNNLMAKEESIYFDAMRIDLACEESIKEFLEKERITARLQKHFELEVKGV